MLLEQLTLHNVGTYVGRQSVNLSPISKERPIVLFGGLNGAGKTTLLDALQLCLYGTNAKVSGRKNLAYDDYLLQTISRSADTPEAAVEVAFRHMREGQENRFRIHRSWIKSGKGCSERLEVVVNDRMDPLLTEHWAEQVEEFLPSRIAPLFLYDGEKIEGYADPQSSARMIATAVNNLLGLDLVEKLSGDLVLLERRKRSETKSASERRKIDELESVYLQVDERRKAAVQRRASLFTQLEQARKYLAECEELYRQEGGVLYERRSELEADKARLQVEHASVEKELREFSAGPAPLLLVQNLLSEIDAADRQESKARLIKDAAALLRERDSELLQHLASWGVAADTLNRVSHYLLQDIEQRTNSVVDPVFGLSAEARAILSELQAEVLPSAEDRRSLLLQREVQALKEAEEAQAAVQAIPTEDALTAVVSRRNSQMDQVASFEKELRDAETEEASLGRELDRRGRELDRLRREAAGDRLASEETQRLLRHSGKVRATLSRFQGEIVRRHVERIEALILDSLKQLLRKNSLVHAVSIDPDTFTLELFGADGRVLPPERLSAGERQLLSVAILWGLARASRRPLPTVIDTPLGRLDSAHRRLLLTRYFPRASHQVILLSTDEEISGSYYESLKPWIGRSYELEFDDTLSSTTIRQGYFGGEAHHGH